MRTVVVPAMLMVVVDEEDQSLAISKVAKLIDSYTDHQLAVPLHIPGEKTLSLLHLAHHPNETVNGEIMKTLPEYGELSALDGQ